MSIWQYIRGDKHVLSHLINVEKYFITVINFKHKSLDYALSFQKYGLPNWRTEVLRRRMALEDARESWLNVSLAIKEHPDFE